MNKHFPAVFTGIAAIVLFAGSFTWNQSAAQQKESRDTIPSRRELKTRDLDEALAELDRSAMELERQLHKIERERFDTEKIRVDIERSLKDLDPEKLKLDHAALSREEREKLRKEISRLRDTELPRLRDIEIPRMEEELRNLKPRLERSIADAKVSIEHAREHVAEYKEFESALVADGLVNKEKFTIQHKDGVLTINGTVQPAAVYNKHRSFLEKHKKFTWKKDTHDSHLISD